MFGYEEKVYTSKTGGFEMYGNKGTDGLLYADRTPLPNYYELQHNYARAAVTDSVIAVGKEQKEILLHIRNRFDFLNLKGNAVFRWALTEDRDTVARGAFSPECEPHGSTTYPIALASAPDTERICLLNIEILDNQGLTFHRQSIRINPAGLTRRLLDALTESTANPMEMIQEGPMIRAGRKATLAEKIKVEGERPETYLIPLSADSTRAGMIGTCIQTEQAGNTLHYTFTLTPDSSDTFL